MTAADSPSGFLASLERQELRYREVTGREYRAPDPPWNPTFIPEVGEAGPPAWKTIVRARTEFRETLPRSAVLDLVRALAGRVIR